ncbi:MAG TPA: hydrogen peroxide-dependent heme synthase [Candidatus Binataceae bacterium]|nr:hydrogen peroxide-dependent heme synthase [Candidatus Binataceae bacterium]
MKDGASGPIQSPSNPAPNTLEGFAILHQFFRIRRREWKMLPAAERASALTEAAAALTALGRRENGESAFFVQLGHKGDLIAVHYRRSLDELAEAEQELARLAVSEFLEQSGSYVSVIEIGLYEATVRLHEQLAERRVEPHSPEWREAVDAELDEQRGKLASRLWPRIPERRYLCFYPMNKRRAGADNWYMLPLAERQRLMHEHGMIGRRYAGRVNQVISGSIGFDDWEWGVDLFADDPLVFKKLVYDMRFDESSARYAEFGPFYIAVRMAPNELGRLMGAKHAD